MYDDIAVCPCCGSEDIVVSMWVYQRHIDDGIREWRFRDIGDFDLLDNSVYCYSCGISSNEYEYKK